MIRVCTYEETQPLFRFRKHRFKYLKPTLCFFQNVSWCVKWRSCFWLCITVLIGLKSYLITKTTTTNCRLFPLFCNSLIKYIHIYIYIFFFWFEREKYQCERNIDLLPPACPQTGDQIHSPLVHRTMLQPAEPSGQGWSRYF